MPTHINDDNRIENGLIESLEYALELFLRAMNHKLMPVDKDYLQGVVTRIEKYKNG